MATAGFETMQSTEQCEQLPHRACCRPGAPVARSECALPCRQRMPIVVAGELHALGQPAALQPVPSLFLHGLSTHLKL